MSEDKSMTFNYDVKAGKSILEVRHGEAEKVINPIQTTINGTIDTVLRYLKNRHKIIAVSSAYILIDREKMNISLKIEEHSPIGDSISGNLEVFPMFKEFGINSGTYRSTIALAEFFKYRRTFFENHSENMTIITALKNFTGEVKKEIEMKQNVNTGDKRVLIDRVVTNNLPQSFRLKMPIFKGTPKVSFEVELMFNPDDLTCAMVSPEASDLVEKYRNDVIDDQIRELEAFGIVIIEK